MEEEKFSQIRMDIGSLAEQETVSENENSPKEETAKAPKKSVHVSAPENLTISDEIIDNSNDDDKLVSPNAEIFRKLTDQVENIEDEDNATVSAFTGAFKKQERQEVRLDETYASNAQSDKNFMQAFGIGGMNTINIGSENGEQRTTEIETMQGDIHSDYYEYTSRHQRTEIVGLYKYAKKSIRTKIIISSIIALILFFVENISLFGENLPGILNINAYPYLHWVINFLLFAGCIICSY